MNLPVLGATGPAGLAPCPDQPAVPGFALLVTALLAGSDVISDEVAATGVESPGPRSEGTPKEPAPDEDDRVEIGHDAPWPALMVHPSLVADALLRHLDRVGTFGDSGETPMGESPPIEPTALSQSVAAGPIAHVADTTADVGGAASPVRLPAPAAPSAPAGPDGLPIGRELDVAQDPQASIQQADQLEEPATPVPGEFPGGQPPVLPPAAAVAAPEGGSPITNPVVAPEPPTDRRIDPARAKQRGFEGFPADRSEGTDVPRVAADRPTDGATENELEQKPLPTVRSEAPGEAPAVPSDRAQRDADVTRLGTRSPEALSTAARRVEDAVRQLEAAPPPSSVTMVIEELDLRLTVAIRPDGVHLSAPGPEAPMLIRSLEEALHSRGFDLSGRQRDRQGRQQPEAPAIPLPPRPTTRPASGLRL